MFTSARLIGLATAISVFVLAGGCFFHSRGNSQDIDNGVLSGELMTTSLPTTQVGNQQLTSAPSSMKKIQKEEKSKKKEIKPEIKKTNKPLRPK